MLHSQLDLGDGDIRLPNAAIDAALDASDGVVVCTPLDVALAAIPPLQQRLRPGALWVDTCSVKTVICRALAASNLPEILSIDPMASPELGLGNQNVAVVQVKRGPQAEAFLHCLRDEGATLVEVAPEEHDRNTAAIQVATHAAMLAFGLVLSGMNYKAAQAKSMWTPPHQVLLMLLSRISGGNAHMYWEIQNEHPDGANVRDELTRAAEQLIHTVQSGGVALETVMRRIQDVLGDEREELARQCAALLTSLRDLSPDEPESCS